MKKLLSLLAFLIPFHISFSQAWQWARHDSLTKNGYSICTDGLGNCYTAGDSLGFEKILKYDNSGNVVWKKNCATGGQVRAIASDGLGHIVAASDSMSSYDLSGNLLWNVDVGSGTCYGMSCSTIGNIFVTGSNFVGKFDSLGVLIWYDTISGKGCAVSVDSSENIYVTGRFAGMAVFGPDTLVSAGAYDIFVAKFNTAGVCLWGRSAGGSYATSGFWFDCGNGIASDPAGNIYVAGQFVDSADFDSFHIVGTQYDEIFLAKYDTYGNVLWVRTATGGSDEEGRCVAIDRNGDILMGGSYVPSVDFGSVHLTGWGNYDAFVAKYDNNGNFKSVINAGGPSWNEYVYGVCCDNVGNVFTAGVYCGTAFFDSDSLSTPWASGFWLFVARIDETMGVSDHSDQGFSFKLFPNPALSILNVEFESEGKTTVEVKNILGQKMFFQEISSIGKEAVSVNVSEFPSGVYVIQLISDGKMSSKKFVKQ